MFNSRTLDKKKGNRSYDIYLNGHPCDKCGHSPKGPELPNPTYNLSKIFDLALTGDTFPNPSVKEVEVILLDKATDRPRGLRMLCGKKAGDTENLLLNAVKRMETPSLQKKFKKLEPDNGWGSLEGAIKVMKELLKASQEYPDHVWEIC